MNREDRKFIWKLDEQELMQLAEELDLTIVDTAHTALKFQIIEVTQNPSEGQLKTLTAWSEEFRQNTEELNLHKWTFGMTPNDCTDLMKSFSIEAVGPEVTQRKALLSFFNSSTGTIREGLVEMAEDFVNHQTFNLPSSTAMFSEERESEHKETPKGDKKLEQMQHPGPSSAGNTLLNEIQTNKKQEELKRKVKSSAAEATKMTEKGRSRSKHSIKESSSESSDSGSSESEDYKKPTHRTKKARSTRTSRRGQSESDSSCSSDSSATSKRHSKRGDKITPRRSEKRHTKKAHRKRFLEPDSSSSEDSSSSSDRHSNKRSFKKKNRAREEQEELEYSSKKKRQRSSRNRKYSSESNENESDHEASKYRSKRMSTGNLMDTVRKWNIHFAQIEKPQDAISFLDRVLERAKCYQIEKDRLPKTMPEFLRGQAMDWYRDNNEHWESWRSFAKSFTNFFVPHRMRMQFKDDIVNYTQKPEQSFKEYQLAIQALMRFVPAMRKREKLDRIYNNCRPEYKVYAKRHDFRTLSELRNMAETYESIMGTPRNSIKSQHKPDQKVRGIQYKYSSDHQRAAAITTAVSTTESRSSKEGVKEVETKRTNPFKDNQPPIKEVPREENRSRNTRDTTRPQYQCYNCDGFGHTARYCRQARKPWCSLCKRRGVTTEACGCKKEDPPLQWCHLCRRQVEDAANCICKNDGPSNQHEEEAMASEHHFKSAQGDSRPHSVVNICGREFVALLDTGSTASYVNEDVANLLNEIRVEKGTVSTKIRLADGSIKNLTDSFEVDTTMDSIKRLHKFTVMPTLSEQVLIGDDFLKKEGICLCNSQGNPIKVMPTDLQDRDRILAVTDEESKDVAMISQCPTTNELPTSNIGDVMLIERSELNEEQEQVLQSLLHEEFKKFDALKGCTNYTEHVIKVKTHEPVKQRYFPKNPKMCEVIHKQVDELIQNGQIEPSSSAYASPVVLVKKKDGSWRMCIDYRKLNEISVKDAYPMPQIPSILNRLKEAKFVTAIDLKNGYWQVSIEPKSRQYTAFTVPGRGLYQWKVMPFGLHSAPATFQRLLDQVITMECEPFAIAYLDDIIIFSKSFEDHLQHIKTVLTRLQQAGLKINKEKSIFCKKELKYLGHIVGNGGIRTDPEKVRAIKDLEAPTTVSGVRRIIGMAAWYSKFIQNFSEIVAPLHELLKKETKFVWSNTHQEALNLLKQKMTEAPVMSCPDYRYPFCLQTDASNVGVGAVLFQRIGEKEHVIAYSSRKLRPPEKNYTTTEKECLAIVWGIEKNLEFLQGIPFTVITDHMALRWIFKLPNPTGRLGRWVLELRNHDFSIEFRKGKYNVVPDALSRDALPVSEEEIEYCNFAEHNEDCEWIKRKKNEVMSNPEKHPEFTIEDNNLLRNCGFGIIDGNNWKLCIPQQLREKVIIENHSEITSGHFGTRKTINKIQRFYYWPGMHRDVKRFIDHCKPCLENKIPQEKPAGLMYTTPATIPWEVVTIDFVGPFPRSSKGHRHLLVIQDKFTKWVEVTPLSMATSNAVKRLLREKIFCRFGWPKTLISDNGSQFVSKSFKKFLKEQGIRHQLTPIYSPQCNSTERVNRVIKTMIRQYIKDDHRRWDADLPELQFAVNTATQDSTGFSAAQLNFGRDPRIANALHEVLGLSLGAQKEDAQSFCTRMKETIEMVRANIAKASVTQSKYYNLRRRDWTPAVGDIVYKRNHPQSNAVKGYTAKLERIFSGPFRVHNYVSPTIVELKSTDPTYKKVHKIHLKDLKKVNSDVQTLITEKEN